LQHDLNNIADDLAGSYNAKLRACAKTLVLHPEYEAELEHDKSIITSKLSQIAISAVHTATLKHYIIKCANWHPATFDKVDWEAHKRAFNKFNHTQRISITKLAHGLYHTNLTDMRYYGNSDQCPCCQGATETLQHVFTCPSPDTADNRKITRTSLQSHLEHINTPPKIVHAIIHGLTQWEETVNTTSSNSSVPFRGTVLPADCILVQAYLEQSNEIGWLHFLHGRISTKWSCAYQSYHSKPHQEPVNALPWAAQVVRSLWDYSTAIWKFRNGVKYGHTQAEAIEKELKDLQHQVRTEFKLHDHDPFKVSPQFKYQYANKEIKQRLLMGRDSLNSWIWSVNEAKKHQEYFCASLKKISTQFFRPKK
jgi:hypothetical protein